MGYLHSTDDIDQIKSDIVVLLLSNWGERVMMPTYGANLRKFIFEPNDAILRQQVQQAISQAITNWEPRVIISVINITSNPTRSDFAANPNDSLINSPNMLAINIQFYYPNDLQTVQALDLEIPLP